MGSLRHLYHRFVRIIVYFVVYDILPGILPVIQPIFRNIPEAGLNLASPPAYRFQER